ncbi:MAG: PorT family protein [Hymenobacter sp.]|nr:MAG: PorT family protein [Hymenobacter sp.]
MKKLLLSTTAAALVAVAAAPAAHAQSVRFGLKAGANLSNLSGDLTQQDQYKNRFGFQGGAMLNLGLIDDDFLAIQLEALYSQKGFKYADQQFTVLNTTYRNTGNVRYDYLDVPVLLRLKTGGVFFEAGPQYSYLLNISNNRTFTQNGNVVSSASSTTSNLDNVKRNELGYAAGLGFQAESGFLIGLRYNGAFTDFAKDGYSNNEFRNARNSTFQAYVGFMLGGK